MAISRKLPCLLNDEDILDRGRQLANAEFSYNQVDRERKSISADFKTQLGAIDGRIAELTNAIRDRVEERDVECYIEMDHRAMLKQLIRRDTGETVETFEMSESERQGSLL